MKFISNRIVNPAGNSPSFDDWVKQFLKEASDKTAGREAAPEQDGDSRGQGRGQVINTEGEEDMTNNPECPEEEISARKDTGGTTDQKKEKKEASCGKEMGESDDAGKVTEDHTEASPGDDANPEPKVLINNDPNYQKGESVDGKKNKKEKKTESNLKVRFQKIATMDRISKLVLFASLSSNKEYLIGTTPLGYVEAMTGLKFANMTSEEKEWFKDFWLTMYPAEYVEQMVKDR
jgi:hypothetical protein